MGSRSTTTKSSGSISFELSTLASGSGNRDYYDYDEATGHYTVNNFQFTVVQVNANNSDATPGGDVDVLLRAYGNVDESDPSNSPNGATQENAHITALTNDSGSTVPITAIYVNGVSIDLSDRGLVVPVAGNGYVVRNLETNDVVRFETASGYERAEVSNATGSVIVDGTTYTFEGGDRFDLDDPGFLTFGVGSN